MTSVSGQPGASQPGQEQSSDHSPYWRALGVEDARLARTLAAIRRDSDAGLLTVREAADNRVAVLETHLELCEELRRRFLDSELRAEWDRSEDAALRDAMRDDGAAAGPTPAQRAEALALIESRTGVLPAPNFYPADGPRYADRPASLG